MVKRKRRRDRKLKINKIFNVIALIICLFPYVSYGIGMPTEIEKGTNPEVVELEDGSGGKHPEEVKEVSESLGDVESEDTEGEYTSTSNEDGETIEEGIKPQEHQLRFSRLAVIETPELQTESMVNDARISNTPVNIVVAGGGTDVTGIEMVGSPKEGKNYIFNGEFTYIIPEGSRDLAHKIDNVEELKGEEVTLTFEAKKAPGDVTSVPYVSFQGVRATETYDFIYEDMEKPLTDEWQTFEFHFRGDTIPDNVEDYPRMLIRKSEMDNEMHVKKVKLEVGTESTPYTKAPGDVLLGESENLFDKETWLSSTPEQKPKTTGVPYVDLKLEPNTQYTLGTNVPMRVGGYYDVFFMNSSGNASSALNGVTTNQPRTIRTGDDGIVRVAMRDYDAGLTTGERWIQLNKGAKLVPYKSQSKIYPVTANGEYTFQITDAMGTIANETVNVQNFYQIKGEPKRWVGEDVNLTVDGGTEISRIRLPEGSWVEGSKVTYKVSQNGVYTFKIEDKGGSIVTHTENVKTMDKVDPNIYTKQSTQEWTNQAVDIELTSDDEHSGVASMEMTGSPSEVGGGRNLFRNSNFDRGLNSWVSENLTTLEANNNVLKAQGAGRFFYSIIIMPIGETYTVSFDARKDGEPSGVYSGQGSGTFTIGEVEVGNEWERHSITFDSINTWTVSFSFRDKENPYYFRNLKLEKGSVATPYTPAPEDGVGSGSSVYTVPANGVYTFTATDFAGNTGVVEHEVTNIDSTPPSIEVTQDPSGYTNEEELALKVNVSDKQSGVESIKLPNGEVVSTTQETYKVSENGEYKFIVTDTAGNKNTHTETVTNFDRTAPNVINIDKGNLIDPSAIHERGYVIVDYDEDGGKFGLTAGELVLNYDAHDWVDYTSVTPNTTYIFKGEEVGLYNARVAFYDKDKNYISGTLNSITPNTKDGKDGNVPDSVFTTPEGTEYVRVSAERDDVRVPSRSSSPETWGLYEIVGEQILNIDTQDTQSGVRSIMLPDGTKVLGATGEYLAKGNGDYEFTVTDNLGNQTTETIKVNHIMSQYAFYLYDEKGNPVKGAGFDLIRNSQKYAESVSNSEGLVQFGLIPKEGSYTIKQTKAPDGHVVNPDEKDVEVGDTTEPEEFISYPRGTILPATGELSGIRLTVLVITLVGALVIVGCKKREKLK